MYGVLAEPHIGYHLQDGADAWQSHLPGTQIKEQLLECAAIIKKTIMSFPE